MQTLKYAFRFLSRKKVFTIINVLGLALSLACCIVLGRYLYREVTVDRHAIDPESIYTVNRYSDKYGHNEIDIEEFKDQYDNDGRAYIDEIIEDYCSVYPCPEEFIKMFGREQTINTIIVDSTFTNFFHYDIEGDADALTREDACWISDEYVKKSGRTSEEFMGECIDVFDVTCRIVGVFHKPECQVIFDPDIIVPRHGIHSFISRRGIGLYRVRPDFDADEASKKLSEFGEADEHMYIYMDTFLGHKFVSWSDYYFSTVERVSEKELRMCHHGNVSLCWILLGVLLLILVVGVVNFINLYLVFCQRRQSEAGVRRVFGRQTLQLFLELWCELMILTSAAVFVAWLLVELTTPFVETMLGNTHAGTYFDVILNLGVLIFLPLLAIVYPFVKQRRNSPQESLRQKAGSVQSIKTRTIILGVQYFISISLVIMSLWMSNHLSFLLDSPIGFDSDRVLLVRPVCYHSSYGYDKDGNFFQNNNRDDVETILTAYTKALKESSLVESYCITQSFYLPISTNGYDVYYNNKGEESELKFFKVTPRWFEVFGVKLQEGVLPNPELTTLYNIDADIKEGEGIEGWLANRMSMKRLGYQTLEGSYARRRDMLFMFGDENGMYYRGTDEYPIMGIVGDHYSGHRTLGASAAIYLLNEDDDGSWSEDSYLAVRFRPEDKEALYSFILKLQEDVCPSQNLETIWLSDLVEGQYESDRLMANVYTIFSAIAVFICCLGLLGLSLFDIRQRYREIAIRKANGAHRKDLYLLLGKKYMYVMLSAFVLSVPVTYMIIHNYTESFIESAPLTPIIYLEALGIMILITMVTLISQLENAARVNVASVVKTE